MVSEKVIQKIGQSLCDPKRPMKARYRDLFTLRNLGGTAAIDCIAAGFVDTSALLKHEMAYCLGQMQDDYALSILRNIIEDQEQHVIVRHEAAEALGAIGKSEDHSFLSKYKESPAIELAETCDIACDRIAWLTTNEQVEANPFSSVDPAPPLAAKHTVNDLLAQLLNTKQSLFNRYRAMFSLRNLRTEAAVLAITKGFEDSSVLFRHEVAYVLGQLSHTASEAALTARLQDTNEHPIVRHECAEALGAIATDSCMNTLKDYLNDPEPLVSESCEVALDMCDYSNSDEFQYANALQHVEENVD